VAGEPPRELDLLVPEAGRLPLIGRQDRFAELQAWLDDEIDISVHALIGRAGTGKTRLALEFCGTIDSDPSGKGEWRALTGAEEAVRLYRDLAEARPGAFIPDLARSLGVLGNLYGGTGSIDLAIATLAEAIQLLTPTFREVPAAVTRIMTGILQSYRAQCAAVGREPDAELLRPVVAVFESFTPREEKG
jgi:hypothetical protein